MVTDNRPHRDNISTYFALVYTLTAVLDTNLKTSSHAHQSDDSCSRVKPDNVSFVKSSFKFLL